MNVGLIDQDIWDYDASEQRFFGTRAIEAEINAFCDLIKKVGCHDNELSPGCKKRVLK